VARPFDPLTVSAFIQLPCLPPSIDTFFPCVPTAIITDLYQSRHGLALAEHGLRGSEGKGIFPHISSD